MTPLRLSMLTATLLAFAATVHGQAPPPTSCPDMPSWLTPYLQHSMQTWQQVRSLCTGQSCDNGVCASAVVGSPGCCKAGSCAAATAGCVKCCEAAQAPASCCCAKACGGCESCKTKNLAAALARFDAIWITGGGVWQNAPVRSVYLPPLPPLAPAEPIGIALPQSCPYQTNLQQADRNRKTAEFYRRTGHPDVACFYYDLMARTLMPQSVVPLSYHTAAMPMSPRMPVATIGCQLSSMPCMGPMAIAMPQAGSHFAPAPPMPPPLAWQGVQVQVLPAQPMVVPPALPSRSIAACNNAITGYTQAGTLTPALNIPICNSTFTLPQPQFGGPQPATAVAVAACSTSAPALKHAHLVTPDFEAHCTRMHHRGDMIVLEGDVLLLCKKHAQPIRIEAQRVTVNMKDGTFTVDSEAPAAVSGFGVTRTSAVGQSKEQPNGQEPHVQVIRLRNVAAADIANLLNDYLTRSSTALKKHNDVVVVPEPISNSLFVTAPPRCLDTVMRIINEFDGPSHPR